MNFNRIAQRIASGQPELKVSPDGTKRWWLNHVLHREDGPAYEKFDGSTAWFLNGKRHRIDGPAIEEANGNKKWFLNGKELTEEELNSEEIQKKYPELYHSWVIYNVMNQ